LQAGYQCAGCGEWNETFVDPSGGRRQQYVEDCQVCCRPNVLQAVYDDEFHEFVIGARLE
jgi:cysteine-rich CPXCG protein